jgi:hypothetical protein
LSVLQDGGFEYKKAIVDSILILIREIPAAKEAGLAHLCEFIEVHICASAHRSLFLIADTHMTAIWLSTTT